jgi:hypothetical protein
MNKKAIRTLIEDIIQDNSEFINKGKGGVSEYIIGNDPDWYQDFVLGDDSEEFANASESELAKKIEEMRAIVEEYDHGEGFWWEKY